MQIPVLQGIYTDNSADFRVMYPVNLEPVVLSEGIGKGYIRPGAGFETQGTSPGVSRGGIDWKGTVYRVFGTKLCQVRIDGFIVVCGDVGSGGQCSFDYSFDLLAVTSGGRLYYWDGMNFTQVTDPDLGTALDVVWVDGYFMTTDGNSLVVSDVLDPTSFNTLHYGSSEIDPDPIVAVLKLRDEIYAVNTNTIEVFTTIVSDGFPFARVNGAQIMKGAVGTYACCVFTETIAFLGGGRNESNGIHLGVNAGSTKISSREIDIILATYTPAQLALVIMEARISGGQPQLLVHLPDRTLVYDLAASEQGTGPVWFVLTSSVTDFSQYRAQDFVFCYGRWNVADPAGTNYGYLDTTRGDHWGQTVRWEFGSQLIYNNGNGAIFNQMELVAITGRISSGEPRISTAYSMDGQTWSVERFISAGMAGMREKRLVWFQNGFLQNYRMQRFRGDTQAFLTFARLEVQLEPLAS